MKGRLKKPLKAISVAVVCLLVQACASPGEPVNPPDKISPEAAFQQAKQAYTNKDYVSARQLLAAPADAGHSDAQYTLGYMAYYGQGFARDESQALVWFRKSAAQGNPKAIKVLNLLSDSTDSQTNSVNDVVVTAIPEQNTDFAQQTMITDSSELGTDPVPESGSSELANLPQQNVESPSSAQWIHNQPREKYTIQLISGKNEVQLKRFVEQNQLQNQVAFVRSTRDGQAWFTLVYGSFATRAEAKLALDTLDPAVKKSGPWIRLFGQLQALTTPR